AGMSRWRVTLVVNSLARGGAETQLVRLARGLVADGHQVRVTTLLPDDDLAGELAAAGIAWDVLPQPRHGLPGVRGPAAVAALASRLRRERPDVAVSFLYQANVVTRLAARA